MEEGGCRRRGRGRGRGGGGGRGEGCRSGAREAGSSLGHKEEGWGVVKEKEGVTLLGLAGFTAGIVSDVGQQEFQVLSPQGQKGLCPPRAPG